jgi:hypothetical protein
MRVAAVGLFGTSYRDACPPGIDPVLFGRALIEDVVDVLASLSGVDTAIVADESTVDDAKAVSWAGAPVVTAATPVAAFVALRRGGYEQATLFVPDVPDLPALLAAKPFSGLSTSDTAVVPALGGGLIALGSRLPVPAWLPSTVDFGTSLEELRAAAPAPAELAVAPTWRRLRAPTDVATLDPALEGWEATRALLSGR